MSHDYFKLSVYLALNLVYYKLLSCYLILLLSLFNFLGYIFIIFTIYCLHINIIQLLIVLCYFTKMFLYPFTINK